MSRLLGPRPGRAIIAIALLGVSLGCAASWPPVLQAREVAPPPTAASESRAGDGNPAQVRQLAEQLAEPATRAAARDALISMGAAAVTALVPSLEHPDMTVRWEVATILGSIGDGRAAPALVQRVVVDDNPHVRWRSLWSLSRFAEVHEATIASLRTLLQGSTDERLRWNAAVALSMFGRDDGLPLLHVGVWQLDPWRRWEAINALGRVHDNATVTVLAVVLSSDRERERQEAVLSLGKIGGDRAVQLLISMLDDPSEDVRWRACLSLGWAADQAAVEPLEALLERGDLPRVVEHARQALDRLQVRPIRPVAGRETERVPQECSRKGSPSPATRSTSAPGEAAPHTALH